MVGVKTANTSSGQDTTRKSIKGSDRGTSSWRRRSRAAASARVILACSFTSHLIDNSFAVSKDSPGALHDKLGALAFSASSR